MAVRFFAALVVVVWAFLGAARAEPDGLLSMPDLGEDGLYRQSWFLESFLDLGDDVEEARAAGKRVAIIWEQRGCPYCRELHQKNLRIPEVVDYVRANFEVIQLNIWGDKEVTDLDGEVLSEKKMARKHRINFTPTVQFLPETREIGKDTPESWRLIGYWKPFHFMHSFMYVKEKGYEDEVGFQSWLSEKGEELRKQGKEFEIW